VAAGAQDELLNAARAAWPTREPFAQRIAQLLRTGHQGPPVWRGDRSFSTRRLPDQEHAVVLVHDADGSEAGAGRSHAARPRRLVTLDGLAAQQGRPLPRLPGLSSGTEQSVLHVLDVATGDVRRRTDRALAADSPVAWLADSAGFYYVRILRALATEDARYHRRVWLHRLGHRAGRRPEVFGEGPRQRPPSSACRTSSTDGGW
jgi:prolyl oligopeptidase